MNSIDQLHATSDDQEALSRLYNDVVPTRRDAFRLAAEHTQTFTVGDGRRFRSVVFTPEEPDGSVVFVPAEFMHGRNHTAGIVRALAIQALSPQATIAYMPNDRARWGHSHTNLSMKEKWDLFKNGNFDPYVERYNAVLDQLPRDSRDAIDARVTVFGASQGGVVASAYAAHPEARTTGISVVESPNVVDNRALQLGLAFPSSGPLLKEVIARNYAEVDQDVTLQVDLNRELGMDGMLRYFGAGLRLGNLALTSSMNEATLEPRLTVALDKGAAVVHAWATGADISPKNLNRAIAANLENNDLYESYEFEGDHSITNDNLYMAALARRAFELRILPDER